MQKKRDLFTCSFLALTYWFHLNLISIFKKFRLFETKPFFKTVRPIINNWMNFQKSRSKKGTECVKGGNFAWNALNNQTLRRLVFSMWRGCLAVIAAYSFWTNYSLLIFNEKNTWCQPGIQCFVIFYEFN